MDSRKEWFNVGDYKKLANEAGNMKTSSPKQTPKDMQKLMEWYNSLPKVTIKEIIEFHARFEKIHPFQDGNGRTGRLILFRECLNNDLIPFIIEDKNRNEYIEALKTARDNDFSALAKLFRKEQKAYKEEIDYFMQNCIPQETSSMTLF